MDRIRTTIFILAVAFLPGFGQPPQPQLDISHLTGDLYVYTTYRNLNGYRVPSNSMYVVTQKGVVLIDTPWDTTQFQPLLDSIKNRHHIEVTLCIATHYHDDRTAGLDFLKSKGIRTYTSRKTDALCRQYGEPQAEFQFDQDTTFRVGRYKIQTFYPGEGHTRDNIVVWIRKGKVLYGGCLIKSTESKGLGNVADANLSQWRPSIQRVMRKYPRAKHTIPGHFGWESNQGLAHTLRLLKVTGE